ncbi:MAG: AGE family epimerase/isomerase [Clostridia bacterium]|nr:AGE family epimerase/isomerase [Clostridia bacterium]
MIDYEKELELYRTELYENVLPFWEKYAPDTEHGGFFTCFTGNGDRLLSTDKYIWSQGRMLWVLSHILKRGELSTERAAALERYAHLSADFLMKHSRLENGNCVFLTDREGKKKLTGGIYDSSIYVDCFVIIGLAEYGEWCASAEALDFALDLYRHARGRYLSGKYNTEPYPVPKGYRTHGLPMIFTNTARTLADALRKRGRLEADGIYDEAYGYACDIIDSFVDGDGILHEMIPTEGGHDTSTLLGRYINPGHTIEDCWFLEDEWARVGDKERHGKTLSVLKNALRLGWDTEYGGIRLFADMTGAIPFGEIPDPDEGMVRKVTSDNTSKLWWVHSEALYSTLLFSSDPEVAEWYGRVKEYTLRTFPNRENDLGEWIQIRDREGKPENRVVALPVKDPFHIMRNLLLLMELCEDRIG